MVKNYSYYKTLSLSGLILKFCFSIFIAVFAFTAVFAQSSSTLASLADAYVRNGAYASNNYGSDTSLIVKGSASSGYTRSSYLKFSLNSVSNISSAKLRIYGRNTDNTSTVSISSYGIDNDSWTESGITYSNAPAAASAALSTTSVNSQVQYYEFDVTNYVVNQFAGDKVVSFLIKDATNQNSNIVFNSRENSKNSPQLIINTSSLGGSSTPANSLIFIENLDKIPSNDHFIFSRIQTPWSRDGINYNANHDSLTIRIHNKGIDNLIINNLILSNNTTWKFVKLKGADYNLSTSLPLSISSGTYADLTVRFVALDAATRVKILHDTLTIGSNDNKSPSKAVFLDGLWQKKGESLNEPSSQEIINTFGFKTNTGFGQTDPDKGDSAKLKGNEIKPSYFVRADASLPVSITQIAAYHSCCTSSESIKWFAKGSTTLTTVFTHIGKDGQSLLPRKATPSTSAAGVINPATAFGFKVGSQNSTDASLNLGGKLGIRVWKAIDAKSNIIPNCYIIGNDYLGTSGTNYDYNDNMYFVKNIRPEKGSSFFSELGSTPSDVDFGEKYLSSFNSFTLNLASLGKTYTDGSSDPAIIISSVAVTGENKSEFTASMPVKTTLNPQENTTLTVSFKPVSQGLKIADLLVYYNNSKSPLRVPLYGIAKASGTIVSANYRINSGSTTSLTINGKTWSADNQYSYDNLEPYTNSGLTKISGTDEDPLYLKEQSSNADKAPFRYELPVANGDYVVRLHFAELYWGAPGSGVAGGAGSRVMDVSLENKVRLINFDVTQEVGGATALIKNLPVTVTDGKLNINFSSTVNRPMVVAVEVYSFRGFAAKASELNNAGITGAENGYKKVRVYPNPLQKQLMVQFPPDYTGNSSLQIADVTGRVYNLGQVKLQPGGSIMQVDVSPLALKSGVYYLKITSQIRPLEVIKLIVP
jgi:hypothetical protein